MTNQTDDGDLVTIKPGNPHGRTSDSSGGQWYRVVYERATTEPSDEVIIAMAGDLGRNGYPMQWVAVRAVIAAYRDWLLRE